MSGVHNPTNHDYEFFTKLVFQHKNIDEDVLEGEMKKQLYYTKPNEIMIILPSKK